MNVKIINIDTIAIPASTIPKEERRLGVQEEWHVCLKCKYPVSFGWVSVKCAQAIQEQNVPGVYFIETEKFFLSGEEGFCTLFCRDCYTQGGFKALSGRKFKKMSDSWTKKQSRGF